MTTTAYAFCDDFRRGISAPLLIVRVEAGHIPEMPIDFAHYRHHQLQVTCVHLLQLVKIPFRLVKSTANWGLCGVPRVEDEYVVRYHHPERLS